MLTCGDWIRLVGWTRLAETGCGSVAGRVQRQSFMMDSSKSGNFRVACAMITAADAWRSGANCFAMAAGSRLAWESLIGLGLGTGSTKARSLLRWADLPHALGGEDVTVQWGRLLGGREWEVPRPFVLGVPCVAPPLGTFSLPATRHLSSPRPGDTPIPILGCAGSSAPLGRT